MHIFMYHLLKIRYVIFRDVMPLQLTNNLLFFRKMIHLHPRQLENKHVGQQEMANLIILLDWRLFSISLGNYRAL
ncbi:hypothetical protein CDL12_29689 [Handroanthus impetiginosus]|uniref:Uncharacterized protein n=1 Tax=Handroanthus impetiginosus TaxID=429701 RepID=A0A2G9FXQ6_9LAMI|nr:hypothetical protein CDL12_29689 [Handroanthus impetiginosus]